MSDTILELHSYLTFRLSGLQFALALGVVREVAPHCALGRPPGCPPVLEGVLNLAGEAVPVLRLDRLLALPESAARVDSRLVIVADAKGKLALLVDEVVGILELAAGQFLPVSAGDTFNGCVSAQAEFGSEPLYVLNLERLLLNREREAMRHFIGLERQRSRLLAEAPQ